MNSFEHKNKSESRQPHNYYPLLWIRKLGLGLSSLRLSQLRSGPQFGSYICLKLRQKRDFYFISLYVGKIYIKFGYLESLPIKNNFLYLFVFLYFMLPKGGHFQSPVHHKSQHSRKAMGLGVQAARGVHATVSHCATLGK